MRFHYKGDSGIGIGLDIFRIYCNSERFNPPDNDDNDNDDNDKDEMDKDNSEDKNEDDCNCGLSFHDPAAPLALLMVLIGCGALLISRRGI